MQITGLIVVRGNTKAGYCWKDVLLSDLMAWQGQTDTESHANSHDCKRWEGDCASIVFQAEGFRLPYAKGGFVSGVFFPLHLKKKKEVTKPNSSKRDTISPRHTPAVSRKITSYFVRWVSRCFTWKAPSQIWVPFETGKTWIVRPFLIKTNLLFFWGFYHTI